MGLSRQEYWSGLPFPPPGYLPNPGIEPACSALQANSLPSEPPGKLPSSTIVQMYFTKADPKPCAKSLTVFNKQQLSNKQTVKNLLAMWETGLIPGSGRSPGGGHGNPLQYSCLGNPMDRGAWWAIVDGVAKSQTRLGSQHFHTHGLHFLASWSP